MASARACQARYEGSIPFTRSTRLPSLSLGVARGLRLSPCSRLRPFTIRSRVPRAKSRGNCFKIKICRGGGIGIRDGLKIRWEQSLKGSSPFSGTNDFNRINL